MKNLDADAIIVGAGPAGSATAYHLARRGRHVILLDRQPFPRDKSCGDGLTRGAIRLLDEMGVLDRFAGAQKTRGVRIYMKGKGSRDFEYPQDSLGPGYGLVIPRFDLDHTLCQHAVANGAEFWERALAQRLLFDGNRVAGVEVRHQDELKELHANFVVAADGAASRLVAQAGLVAGSVAELGFAIRVYLTDLSDLSDLLEIYAPLTDPSDRYLLPSYGWVFPTGPSTANIGVGLFQRDKGPKVNELLDRFLSELRREDPRFRNARACGRPKGAPLRFDFSPDSCAREGLLLAGDAAGLISPFTGEGISYALESGKFAAEVIESSLTGKAESPAHVQYSRMLARSYVGYFETGRHAARRYLLVWHVLDATFQTDRPLFALCRQAALFPEGPSGPSAYAILEDVNHCVIQDGVRLRADLFSVGDVLNEIARQDWPFLAKTPLLTRRGNGIPFRPALFLLLAAYLGHPQNMEIILASASVELGYLAAIAQLSVVEEPELEFSGSVRPANWSNLFALSVMDFLLSSAYNVGSRSHRSVSRLIAEALAEVCEARVQELRHAFDLTITFDQHLEIVARKTGTLFELPCHLGGLLAQISETQVQTLSKYGRLVGVAHQMAEDVMELDGLPRSIGLTTGADLEEGIYGTPLRLALAKRDGTAIRLTKLLARGTWSSESSDEIHMLLHGSGIIPEVLELARQTVDRAKQALQALPRVPATISLERLADYVVTRASNHQSFNSFSNMPTQSTQD